MFLDVDDDVMRDHFFYGGPILKNKAYDFSGFPTVLFTTYLKTHRPVYY